ncbi:MAG TPA: hypothetical protein VF407_09555 [Polyangiaceae bacterium]
MRWTWFAMLASASCLGLAHCSSDDSAAGPTNAEDAGGGTDATTEGDTGPGPSDAATGDAAASKIDVDGLLNAQRWGDPLASRVVRVLDAEGTLTEITTASDGKFHVAGVATPYDVYVPGLLADGGLTVSDGALYTGITRDDPWISVVTSQPPHKADFGVATNGCSGCAIYVSHPHITDVFVGTGASVTSTVHVQWYGASPITMKFKLFEIDGTGTWTRTAPDTETLTDGMTTTGTVTLTAFGANSSTALSVTNSSGFTGQGASVALVDADGTAMGSSTTNSLPGSVKLPPGTTYGALVTAIGALANGTSYLMDTRYKLVSDVPAALAYTLPDATALVSPADTAVDVLPTDKLTWKAVAGATMYSAVVTEQSTGVSLAAYTSKPEIDLARAQKVGIVLPSQSVHQWQASAVQGASVDTTVQPGGAPPLYGTSQYRNTTPAWTFRPK